MLFKAPWLLIYLTTARWCLEIACPCTHKPHKGSGFIARKPPFLFFYFIFFYKLISGWFIAFVQVNPATQTIAEVLFLPAVLCPFTTADYLYITATLPLSRPPLVSQCNHCLQGRSSRVRGFEVSPLVFFFFFSSALRYISDLLVPNKEKLPRCKKQTVSSIFALLSVSGWDVAMATPKVSLPRGGFERCLCHKREIEKKKKKKKR